MNNTRILFKKSQIFSIVLKHFWFKFFGSLGFIIIFFFFYIYLLKNPASSVTIMPITWIDELVKFEPLALPLYLSLWVYVSLPLIFMLTRRAIIVYGIRVGALCVVGLIIFYFFPTAVPSSNVNWSQYTSIAFLKGADAAGNACPSLHVATAVFSAFWLYFQIPSIGMGRTARWLSICWCIAIVYSTLATKQHVVVDVIAGGILGAGAAWVSKPWRKDF